MKVAIICCCDIKVDGGTEVSIRRLAKYLARDGHVVDVINIRPREIVARERFNSFCQPITEYWEDIRILRVGSWWQEEKLGEKWQHIISVLSELFSQQRYDIVHAFYPSVTGFISTFVAAEFGVPSILAFRGGDIYRDLFNYETYSQTRWALNNCSAVTANNSQMIERIRKWGNLSDRTFLIRNGIDPEDFEEPAATEERNGKTVRYISSGNFRRNKGIEVLLEAFELVNKCIDCRLVFLGEIGPKDKGNMARFQETFSSSENITFTGKYAHRTVIQRLQMGDIYVLPSFEFSDGCPNSVLEAFLAKLPVIATNIAAVRDLVVPGKTGFLAKCGCPRSLADKMIEAAKTDCRSIVAQAREDVVVKHSGMAEYKSNLQIYASLCDA